MVNSIRSFNRTFVLLLFLSALTWTSCQNNDYTPKPRGYFRITLPEREYRLLDSIFPYTFDYPVYCRILPDAQSPGEMNWINLQFTGFRGVLHLSYKAVENTDNLSRYIEDSRSLAFKHIPKASRIEQFQVQYPENKVYGLIYLIKGQGAASPYQFYLTDSLHHFMRGALYFDALPNSDSLKPVIDFVQKDIDHLIETVKWK